MSLIDQLIANLAMRGTFRRRTLRSGNPRINRHGDLSPRLRRDIGLPETGARTARRT